MDSQVRKAMEKLVRDGKVAVLYSPGYGGGWSTECHDDSETRLAMTFDPAIAEAVLNGDFTKAAELAEIRYPDEYASVGQLKVAWLAPGTVFEIKQCDGFETIRLLEGIDLLTA